VVLDGWLEMRRRGLRSGRGCRWIKVRSTWVRLRHDIKVRCFGQQARSSNPPLQAPNANHPLIVPNAPGAPESVFLGEQVMIMISNVKT